MASFPIGAALRGLGPLRQALLLAVVAALVFVPEPGTRAVYEGWPLVGTVLIPVMAPLLLMLLLLDALMARLFLTDASGPARRHYQTVLAINLIGAVALVVRWLPYYAALRV